MTKLAALLVAAGIAGAGVPMEANAKGCLRGAAAGAVAGHYAHHHAIMGALGGCAAGHYYYKHKANKAAAAARRPA